MISILENDKIKKIKTIEKEFWGYLKINRELGKYRIVDKRAFWILCYLYFVNGKDEIIHWKQLEEIKIMGNDRLAYHLGNLVFDNYLKKYELPSEEFYKLTSKAKQLMEQQLKEAEC